MTTAADILHTKPNHSIAAVGPDDSVYSALQLMAERNVGALMVLDGDKVVGILSERDYARKVALLDRVSRDTKVHEIMSPRVMFVNPDNTLEECMALMSDHRLRHLPVMSDGRLHGVVSIGDLVKAMISQQQFIIAQLEQYIAG
jgi:CBS domain-containing protein